MRKQRTVGILLFDEVEILDFAGPYEVFSAATYPSCTTKPFNVKTITESAQTITARNGLKVQPDYSFANVPPLDILIVPGGYGAEEIEIHNLRVLDWIRRQFSDVELLASVCTGALLLAKAGLLDDKKATTHWMDIERLQNDFPRVVVQRNVKFVDDGDIITSGGISAGINMSIHIVSRLLGVDVAQNTARRMDFEILLE